eukprot:2797337-Pyramimonas_sp.AAC.1
MQSGTRLEICGGRGYVSRICVRRTCRVGPNFDIVCGADLSDPNEQWTLWLYLERGVMAVIMAPPCAPLRTFLQRKFGQCDGELEGKL